MRFSTISIAATALLSGSFAAVAPPNYEASSSVEAAPAYTSATTTYYTTRTVMRVVETMTATRNGSTSTFATTESSTSTATFVASASASIYPMGNGTSSSILATGAIPTTASPSGVYEGSASQLSMGAGMAVLIGFAGLLL